MYNLTHNCIINTPTHSLLHMAGKQTLEAFTGSSLSIYWNNWWTAGSHSWLLAEQTHSAQQLTCCYIFSLLILPAHLSFLEEEKKKKCAGVRKKADSEASKPKQSPAPDCLTKHSNRTECVSCQWQGWGKVTEAGIRIDHKSTRD